MPVSFRVNQRQHTTYNYNCRFLKGGGCSRGGGNWESLRIPAGKIGGP